MKKVLAVVVAMLCGGVLVTTVLATRGPQLLVINPDPGAVRPRKIVVLNPVRDRGPEALADQVLRKIAAGQLEHLQPFLGANSEVILKAERRYRPRKWRVGAREDHHGHVRLMYWVQRSGGYQGEEEAWFDLKLVDGEWRLVTYNAVY